MGEPHRYYAAEKKPGTKEYILYEVQEGAKLIHMIKVTTVVILGNLMAKCKAENVKTKSAVFEIEWSTFQIFSLFPSFFYFILFI